jgi:hypothetical protein
MVQRAAHGAEFAARAQLLGLLALLLLTGVAMGRLVQV